MELHTEAANEDEDGDKAFGGRIGLLPFPNLEIGLSALTSKATLEGESTRDYDVFAVDLFWRVPHGTDSVFRGEFMRTTLGAGGLGDTDPDKKVMEAFYLQGSHRFGDTPWEGVVRYAEFEHGDEVHEQWTLGLNNWIAPNIVIKVAVEFNDEEGVTEEVLFFQMAYGF
ncbi:hypothetical protein IIA16_01035 [bacterium]|nr:hypothetical protein [bacterium]